MRQRKSVELILVALFSLVAARLSAQTTAQTGSIAIFQREILPQFDGVSKKILSLANAVPAEKYGWRPGPKVRSVGEAFQHIANGNRLILTFIAPKPLARGDLEQMIAANAKLEQTVTGKDQIMANLKESFEQVRQAVLNTKDSDLARPVQFFGRENTVRGVFFVIVNHNSEHLGQSIAYARMNGIVPPWSNAD
jgi:uncharacterized damage-inducible protein DinB